MIVRELTRSDLVEIAEWRYDGPWQVYDSAGLLDPADGYWAVVDEERLVGYCCVGVEARVPGLGESPGVVDIGVGMDPALVGRGLGERFGSAVVARFGPGPLRAVVQEWNERSLRLTRWLGFVETGRHHCEQDGKDVEYVVLMRDAKQS
ncbi:MAG TPA: GNAT family N-acetyltransferase [Pseudonocardiaceae bacterium]|nr:GNAT family N-acetyltransferase [Pseudonocardiaceae bacterium]